MIRKGDKYGCSRLNGGRICGSKRVQTVTVMFNICLCNEVEM